MLKFVKVLVLSVALVLLSACGGGGNGGNSQNSPKSPTAKSDRESPYVPKIVSVSSINKDTIHIQWLPVTDNVTPDDKIKYKIYVSTVKNTVPKDTNIKKVVTGIDDIKISGLKPSTLYYIRVVAVDENNNSAWSKIETIKTNSINTQLASNKVAESNKTVSSNEIVADKNTTKDEVLFNADPSKGFLKKVKKIETKNGKKIAILEDANIVDVYKKYEYNTKIKLIDPKHVAVNTKNSNAHNKFSRLMKINSGNSVQYSRVWKNGLIIKENKTDANVINNFSKRAKQIGYAYSNDKKTVSNDFGAISIPTKNIIEAGHTIKIPIEFSENLDYEMKVEHDDYNNKCYVYKCININPTKIEIAPILETFNNVNNKNSKPKIIYENNKYFLKWTPKETDASDKAHSFTISINTIPYYNQEKIDVYKSNLSISGKIYVSKGKVEPDENEKQSVNFSYNAGFSVDNTFTMGFEPTIYLSDKFEDVKNKGSSKDIKVKGTITLNQTLKINAQANASLEQTKNIWSRDFVKVVFVGEVPVLLKGTMGVDIKFEGSASADVNIVEKFINKFNLTLGFTINHTEDGKYKITPIKEFNKSYTLTIDGQANGKLSAKITIIPDLKLKVYNLIATRVRLLPYMYGDVDVAGFFNYKNGSNQNGSFDADYGFNNIEAGVGADLSLFIGRGWGKTWVDKWIQLTYPKDAEVEDVSTHKIFHIVKQTPLIKIPTLQSSYDITKLPPKDIDNRAIWINGSYTNKSEVLEVSKFESWDKAKIVNNENLQAQIIKSNIKGGYWLIPNKEGEYNIRLIGHSKLGKWARQYTTVTLTLNDDNNNGILDYWENRYPKPANMSEDLYLQAFQNGKDPKIIKIEDPAKEDSDGNHKPTIDLKVSKHFVYEGDTVILDASNSSDKDGDKLTFTWSDAEYWLADTPIIKKKFTKGVHQVKLVVSDGKSKTSKTVTILVKRKVKENTPKIPIVDGVSPTVVYEDKATEFIITGSNLTNDISGNLEDAKNCKKISFSKEQIKVTCTPSLNNGNSTYKNFIVTNYNGQNIFKIYVKRNNVVEYQGSSAPQDTCRSFYQTGCEATKDIYGGNSYHKTWKFKKETNKPFKNLRVVSLNKDNKVNVHLDSLEEDGKLITVKMTLNVPKDAIGVHKGNFKLVDDYGDIVYKSTGRSAYFWYMLNVQPKLPKTITLTNVEDGVEGSKFTFRVELSEPLDSAYRVKLSLGDGGGGWLAPVDMKYVDNSKKQLYLERTITTAGNRVYRVAIFSGDTRISDWIQGSYKVYDKSKIPKNIHFEQTKDGVIIQWNPVKGAKTYKIYTTRDWTQSGDLIEIQGSPSGNEWLSDTSYFMDKRYFKNHKVWYFAVSADNGPVSRRYKFEWKDVAVDNKYTKYLAGKTLYYLSNKNTAKEMNFNENLTEITYDSNGTQKVLHTKLDNNGLKVGDTNVYLIIKDVKEDYLNAEFDELSDTGVFIETKKKLKLYFDENSVPVVTGDLAKIIVGKTFYQHCKDDSGSIGIDNITFQNDGRIKVEEHNGNTFYIEYKINDNVISTKEKDNSSYKTHTFVKETNEYIQLDEENGEVTKLYKTYQLAQNAPVDDCGGDDGNSEHVPEGKITYMGTDYEVVKAHSYMSNMDNNEVQISLQTDQYNSDTKGGLQFTLKKSFVNDNKAFKSLLQNKKVLYLTKNDIIEYGVQFMTKDNTPTGVKWRSGSIKLTWEGDDTFSIEQNGAELGIEDTKNNVMHMIYFSKTYVHWTDKNYKQDNKDIKVSDLVSGHFNFVDENGTRVSIPSNIWVRITPQEYQVEGHWTGVNCKIDSNGNFGDECYIHRSEEDMRSKFNSNYKVTYQVVIYKETTGDTHYNREERAFGEFHKTDGTDPFAMHYGDWKNATATVYGNGEDNSNSNNTPTANAGADKTIKVGESVTLDASGSSDVEDDADALTYTWTWKSDTDNSTLEKEAKSFEVTGLKVGVHTFTLTVTDTEGASSSDEVKVTVESNATVNKKYLIKKTGQTKSYDQDGNEVTDGSIKDDGYYQTGVEPSYTRDATKEIVTDNITKLQWQDNEEAKTVTKTWEEAKGYCQNLTLGGYSDWRLPTIVELQSIVVDGKFSPSIDTTAFVNYTTSNYYWSSTTYASSTSHAWDVYFSGGHTSGYGKSGSDNVRCVRAGQ